jgi:transposase
MQHITGIPRKSNEFSSLEDLISLNNPVRFVDAFVDALSLVALGFKIQTLKTEGRPSFDTKVFLKIYLYGYLNGLRSSRTRKKCERNIELQWLLCGLVPNYHSISDFRKQNPSGLRNLFKLFVTFLKDSDLIAGNHCNRWHKSRAHNGKKANFNQKKIERHLAYIEEKRKNI